MAQRTSGAGSGFVYLHDDHLGGVIATTLDGGGKGVVASSAQYLPWGGVRSGGIAETAVNFTGQRRDGLELLYYGARYYDPVLGRFLSPDSMVSGASDPQSLNRYAYVGNNPINFTDPSGHCRPDECDPGENSSSPDPGGNSNGGDGGQGGNGSNNNAGGAAAFANLVQTIDQIAPHTGPRTSDPAIARILDNALASIGEESGNAFHPLSLGGIGTTLVDICTSTPLCGAAGIAEACKAYNSGDDEAWLAGEWGIRLVPICKKNMTPNSEEEGGVLRHQRAVIEGVNSQLAAWGVQRLRARTRACHQGPRLVTCPRGCQRPLAIRVTIIKEDGDYLVIVKENQATLLRTIATFFASRADAALAAASLPPWDMREATTLDKGHGRVEMRHLVASCELNDYLAWRPGAGSSPRHS